MKYGFGVDLGGTTVKIAYFNENGDMLDQWEIPTVTENNGSQILPDIAASIRDYREKKGIRDADLLGIGIGVPGPVDGKGNVNRCVNLGWGVFNISKELEALTGLPVTAGNDANVAALGEYWKGGGQGCQSMVFVTLGTGVGGGIVIDRNETATCGCGKHGCVEQYCSATGIVRMAKLELAASQEPSVLRERESISCKDIFDAGKNGDKLALRVLDQYYAYMGEFLGNVCSVVNPEAVVLGGGVSKAGKVLLEGVEPYFKKYVFHAAANVKFTLAVLGNDAGAYGAFKLALDAAK